MCLGPRAPSVWRGPRGHGGVLVSLGLARVSFTKPPVN